MDYSKIIRRLRNDPRLFDTDDDHKIHRILGKALQMRRKREYANQSRPVGPYSGLTRAQLAKSGTCETDWF
jgi:hypothetical protein